MSKNAGDFLKKYLERLKKYTHEKKIDLELYQDIEERISEKLDALGKKIDQKDIVDIVNSLGEPEEIFSDYENEEIPVIEKITQNGENIFKTVKEKAVKATSYSKKKLKQIKKKIDNEKVFEKVKTKSHSIFKKIKPKKTQKKEKQKTINIPTKNREESGFFRSILKFIRGIFAFIFGLISSVVVFGIKLFCLCFRFLFFGFFGGFFLIIALVLLFVAPLTYVDVVIDNQEIFAHIPNITQWSFVVLFVSSTILMASAINSALRQKWVPKFLSFIASITFFIGVFGSLIGVYTFANEYTNEYTKKYIFDFPEYENEEIVLENFYSLHKTNNKNIFNFNLPPAETYLKLKKSPDSTLKFEINASIVAQNQTKADRILAELEPIQLTQNDNIFTVSREENKIFKNVVPFSLLVYQITVFVPKNIKIDLNSEPWSYIGNANLHYQASDQGYQRCHEALIYNTEISRFTCSSFEQKTEASTDTNIRNEDVNEIETDPVTEAATDPQTNDEELTETGALI